jgi:hypothetical protein
MWHRLALFMGCPITELKRRMMAEEFTDWCAYYLLEPWHPDYTTATGAVGVMKTLGAKRVKVSDIMPGLNIQKKTDDPFALFRQAKAAAIGARSGNQYRQAGGHPGVEQ